MSDSTNCHVAPCRDILTYREKLLLKDALYRARGGIMYFDNPDQDIPTHVGQLRIIVHDLEELAARHIDLKGE